MKYFDFKTDGKIPAIGLGTWQLAGKLCEDAVNAALDIGYRHIDTAEIYGNQKEIGKAIQRSRVSREDIFLTSKVPRSKLRKGDLMNSAKQTLKELRTSYLDLFLVHWPNRSIPIEETIEAMELLKKKGYIKNYGVSNFTIKHLKAVKDFDVVVNQVEFHPTLNQKELKEYCDDSGILITAYSPFGKGQELGHPELKKIAEKHGVSSAQVVVSWLISKKIVVIPKSGDTDHLEDNFKAINLELDKEDIEVIDSLDENRRFVNPGFSEW